MPRNGTGTYVLPAGQPVVTNTIISSSVHNTLANDVANALTTSVATDGQTPMAANLAMGNNKITGLANGTLPTDAVAKSQLDSAVTTINASVSVFNNTPTTNYLVNGDMRIAQIATSYALTTTPTYGSIDNWQVSQSTTAAGIFNQVSASGSGAGARYFAKIGRNLGATSAGNIIMCQALETTQSMPLQNKTVILSFWALAGANYSSAGNALSVVVKSGTGTDESCSSMLSNTWTGITSPINTTQTITTTATKYSFVGTIPSNATQVGVQLFYTPAGTAGADDNVYITNVQLEVAKTGQTTGSDYQVLSMAESLQSCQRYIQVVRLNPNEVYGMGGITSTSAGVIHMPLKTDMRSIPTVAFVGTIGNLRISDVVSAVSNCTAQTVASQSERSLYVSFTGTGTPFVVGRPASLSSTVGGLFYTLIAAL